VGHRLGNFWNYKTFNPSSVRLALMPASFYSTITANHSPTRPFTYADLGCNEGDLTLPFWQRLLSSFPAPPATAKAIGVDIDETLIERANALPNRPKDVTFIAANCASRTLLTATLATLTPNPLSLISLFSTTMWIHVHLGDADFLSFLKHLCTFSTFLLIEPQPRKCYLAANKRLRKMGRPTFDLGRLLMLDDVEGTIKDTIEGEGFVQVHPLDDSKTPWGRALCLYKRSN